jgi:hypothetical protein
MKKTLLNFCLLAVTVCGVLYLCAQVQHEHGVFGVSLGAGGLLLWPALLLARTGLTHTWLLLAGAAPVALALVAWSLRARSLLLAPLIGIALSIAYCLLGALAFRQITVPTPTPTPYEADATQKQEYLAAYQSGYRAGLTGLFRTFCFAPEHMARGFGEGSAVGCELYYRCLGIGAARSGTAPAGSESVPTSGKASARLMERQP